MPSNATQNYQLSQWSKDDKIQMEDFNADNAKIDAALAELDEEVNKERIITGSYIGDGNSPRIISLPWTPKLLIVSGYTGAVSYPYHAFSLIFGPYNHSIQGPDGNSPNYAGVSIVTNGFKITANVHNIKDMEEHYVAIR